MITVIVVIVIVIALGVTPSGAAGEILKQKLLGKRFEKSPAHDCMTLIKRFFVHKNSGRLSNAVAIVYVVHIYYLNMTILGLTRFPKSPSGRCPPALMRNMPLLHCEYTYQNPLYYECSMVAEYSAKVWFTAF